MASDRLLAYVRSVVDKPSPFVMECQRIMAARLAASTPAEKEDAEWALTYLFQMNKAGRFDEYLSSRKEIA